MTVIEILKQYPEVTQELQEFFKQMLLNSFDEKNIPTSFKEKLEKEGVSLKMLETYLNATPRLICDFMDEKNIIILITNIHGIFSFTINGNSFTSATAQRKTSELNSVIESIIFYAEKHNFYLIKN